jgi:hypothetical protein
MADDILGEEEVCKARNASLMWTAESYYSMLPWSAIILESVPEQAVAGTPKCVDAWPERPSLVSIPRPRF